MKKSFTKSKLNKEDTTKMQEPRIRVVEESPDFLVPGLVYAQGSLKTNDLVFQDTRGNKFTYIPKDNECESYWVSTYEISQDNKTGEARSISGVFPWVKITPRDALEVAKAFGGFLLLFEQIERLWRYMVKTRVATYMQIYSDSSSLGNYWNNPEGQKDLAITGSNPNWWYNGIDNLCGNTRCIVVNTIEPGGFSICGGSYNLSGSYMPASHCESNVEDNITDFSAGFRIALSREYCTLQ